MKALEVITVDVIFVLLLIGAAVCFGLAAFGVRVVARREINLMALGLLLMVLVPLIQRLQHL